VVSFWDRLHADPTTQSPAGAPVRATQPLAAAIHTNTNARFDREVEWIVDVPAER
jgi:hypothetical protein